MIKRQKLKMQFTHIRGYIFFRKLVLISDRDIKALFTINSNKQIRRKDAILTS